MVTREQLVEQSVEKRVRAILNDRGYNEVEMIDSFPQTKQGKLDKTYVAAGFSFDDGGQQAEMGSSLTRRQYTVEFFVFGQTMTWAKNVASVVKLGLESDEGTLPLLDVEHGDVEIDRMLVDECSSERQPVPAPEPWQEFVWTVHLKLTDEYFASLVV